MKQTLKPEVNKPNLYKERERTAKPVKKKKLLKRHLFFWVVQTSKTFT